VDKERLTNLQISALEKSRVIQEKCDALFHEHHQSESSENFLAAINAFCKYLDSCINKARALPLEKVQETVQQIITVLQELGAELEFIESGIMHKIPWSYIGPFEKAIEGTYSRDVKVLITARWRYGYSCDMQDFYELYASRLLTLSGLGGNRKEALLQKEIDKLEPAFRIIEFPYLERMNILFHCLIGHEVGHMFTDKFTALKQAEVLKLIRAKLQRVPKKYYASYDKERRGRIVEGIYFKWSRIMEEILCDLFCVYIFGPAALFSIYEYATHLKLDGALEAIERGYPSWRYRLSQAYSLLHEKGVVSKINQYADLNPDFVRVSEKFAEIERETNETKIKTTHEEEIKDHRPSTMVFEIVQKLMPEGLRFLERNVKQDNLRKLSDLGKISQLMDKLKDQIPPNNFDHENRPPEPPTLNQIINASWFYKIAITEKEKTIKKFREKYKNQLRLTLKAIEMADVQEQFMNFRGYKTHFGIAKRDSKQKSNKTGALTRNELIELIKSNDLVITPLLNPKKQVGNSSVDVRLGTEFIVMKKRAFSVFDSAEYKDYPSAIVGYQDRARIGYRKFFTIHPRSIVLGCSLEYLSLPQDVMCYVVGKSSWGRLGLVIATATKVDPGFRGCITLELVNHGEVPIKLYPGLPIAQLVFHHTTSKSKYEGDYNIAIGPEFPKLGKSTPDWTFWYPRGTGKS